MLKLSFWNITIEPNVFNLCKHPDDIDPDLLDIDCVNTVPDDDLEYINSHMALRLEAAEDKGYLEELDDDNMEEAHAYGNPSLWSLYQLLPLPLHLRLNNLNLS